MVSKKRKILDVVGAVLILLVIVGFFVPIRTKTGLASQCAVVAHEKDCRNVICHGSGIAKGSPAIQKNYRYNWLFGQGSHYSQQASQLAPANSPSCGLVAVRLKLYAI